MFFARGRFLRPRRHTGVWPLRVQTHQVPPYCAKSQPSRNGSNFGILEAGMVVALGHHPTP